VGSTRRESWNGILARCVQRAHSHCLLLLIIPLPLNIDPIVPRHHHRFGWQPTNTTRSPFTPHSPLRMLTEPNKGVRPSQISILHQCDSVRNVLHEHEHEREPNTGTKWERHPPTCHPRATRERGTWWDYIPIPNRIVNLAMCKAVSIDTCTAVARFLSRFWTLEAYLSTGCVPPGLDSYPLTRSQVGVNVPGDNHSLGH